MVKRLGILIFILMMSAVTAWAAEPVRQAAQFTAVIHLDSPADLQALKPLGLTITSRRGLELDVLVTEAEIARVQAAGWRIESQGPVLPAASKAGYHTYATLATELSELAEAYPNITELFSIGETTDGRKIWAMKISDNADVDEAEPALIYDHSIHGDEQIGFEVALGFIHELLENYGSDDTITGLVDDMALFVVPMTNPDGVEQGTRGNGNWVDLNRNFPYWWEGSTWQPEAETMHLMNFSLEENFVLGINYHAGAEVVNYIWDGIYTRSPDNDLEIMMSQVYAAASGYDITNGADWYIADGTTEDWYHGSLGALTVIVEISVNKMPVGSNIEYYVEKNVPSMIDWATQARRGIWGTTRDADNGGAVEATIFADSRMPVYSDPERGDWYRVLKSGQYTISVWANGYGWNVFNNVTVPAQGHLNLPLELTPNPSAMMAAQRCVVNIRKDASDDPANTSLPNAALGGPDDSAFSLGVNGYAIFDLGANTVVAGGGSGEIVITESDTDGADGYSVKVAKNWTGPYEALGDGTGTASFPLSGVSLNRIRYVLVTDDGDGANSGATPGADIDAIQADGYAVTGGGADDDDDDNDNDVDDDDHTPTDDDDDATDDDDDASPNDDDDDDLAPADDDDDDDGGCGC